MLNFPLPTIHSPFKVFACACIIILLIKLSFARRCNSFMHSCFSSHLSAILHSFLGGHFFPYSACSSLPLPLPPQGIPSPPPPAPCCNPDSQFHPPVSEQSSWMYIHMNWLAFSLFFFLHHAWRRRIKTIDGHNAAGKEKHREINLGSESRWAGDTCIVSHKISCEMKCGEREKTPEDVAGLCNLLLVRINKWKQAGSKVEGPRSVLYSISHIITPAMLELKGPGYDWSVQSSPISFGHVRALHFCNNIKAEEGTWERKTKSQDVSEEKNNHS